jgi:glycosyltransferase involved in cell wall biosynthesis
MNSDSSKYKIAMIDLTPAVPQYDYCLMKAFLEKNIRVDLFMSSKKRWLGDSFRENKIKLINSWTTNNNSQFVLKRIFNGFIYYINLLIIVNYVIKNNYSVIHFQWFPSLMENLFEKYFLKKLKKKGLSIIYTKHNLYPHDISVQDRIKYKKRVDIISPYIDLFIVHTNSVKEKIIKEYTVPSSKIHIIPHGVIHYTSTNNNYYFPGNYNSQDIVFMHFGVLSNYKGSDIVIKAFNQLCIIYPNIKLNLIGRISENYKNTLYDLIRGNNNINFIPDYVSNQLLSYYLDQSNIFLFPYREISQSGALLHALSYDKCIIASDLPSFTETLHSFKKEWFVTANNVDSLLQVTEYIMTNKQEQEQMINKVAELRNEYSWNKIALKTYQLYKSVIEL